MYSKITIWGFWNDDKVRFERTVAVASQPLTDEVMEQALDDEDVFYVFDFGEKILGEHFGFTVTEKEVC